MAQQPQGALAQSPNAAKTKKKPKFTLKELVGRQAAGIPLGPKQIARLQKNGLIAPSPTAPTTQLTPEQQMQRLGTGTTQGVEQQFGYLQQQGAFQPGSFQEQMNKAYENVYGQFQRTQEPEFARQQAEFRQMAAERGLDPNSEAYKTMQSQLSQSQDLARQSAMSSANQAAQQAQAQGFGQAVQQYQLPASMLQAYQPFFAQQGAMQQLGSRQQFETEENRLEREARERLANIQGGYGITQSKIGQYGQLSPEQQVEMLRLQSSLDFANQFALQQMAPRPSTGAGVAAGLAQGIGAGIGSWLGS